MVDLYTPKKHISIDAKDLLDYLILFCQGPEHAAKIEHLRLCLQCSRREVEQWAEELRGAGIPLCSSCKPPFGYYLARTFTEAEPWIKQMKHRQMVSAANMHRAIEGIKMLALRDGVQLSMEAELV